MLEEKIIFRIHKHVDGFKLDIAIRHGLDEIPFDEYQRVVYKSDNEIEAKHQFKLRLVTVRRITELLHLPWFRILKNNRVIKLESIFEATRVLSDFGEVQWEPQLQSVYDAVVEHGIADDFGLPQSLSSNLKLRGYQRSGFRWLRALVDLGLGGILADEMGLGKTIQAIVLLAYCLESYPQRGCIIVCPLSVVPGWEAEIRRYIPKVRMERFIGTRRNEFFLNPTGFYILLTTYATLRQSADSMHDLDISVVILDEAQALKNSESVTTRVCNQLRSRSKILLTGTPIENNIYELWSLVNCIAPGLLGTLEHFKSTYGDKKVLRAETGEANRLRKRIMPFLLKRTKAEVLHELPEKIYKDIHPILTDIQRDLYKIAVQAKRKHRWVVKTISELLKITSHPATYSPEYSSDYRLSGKAIALKEILDALLGSVPKVLIFVRYIITLNIIRELARKCEYGVLSIEGSTDYEERKSVVSEFNGRKGPLAMVLTYQSCGLGLNLQAADVVVHYDRWWNPAVEVQAEDRAHRIGRTADVYVYVMHCVDSIDDKIGRMQAEKRILVEKLLASNMSASFLRDLLKDYETETSG